MISAVLFNKIESSKKLLFFCLFLVVLLLSLTARFYDLEMDPFSFKDYGISSEDEGAYLHNAVNKAYYGYWMLEKDLWNPAYISPVLTYIEYFFFTIFGVSTLTARFVTSIMGILAVFISSLLIFLKNKKMGFIFFIFASLNTFLIAYSRIATLEQMVIFFLIIILGCIVFDTYYSWIFAGVLTPFLFFSKPTSIFFIISVPASLFFYFLIYKDKKSLKNLFNFLIGFVPSLAMWLFWLIPVVHEWLYLNLSFGHRISILPTKFIGAFYMFLQFFFKNQIIATLVILWLFFIFHSIFKKEKIKYIDFFLLLSIIVFYFQLVFLDIFLRRFAMIIPLFLLIAARLMLVNIKGFAIHLDGRLIRITMSSIIFIVLAAYVLFSSIELGAYFYELWVNKDRAHSFIITSREIGKIIPSDSMIYGESWPYMLAMDNRIKAYKGSTAGTDYEKSIMPLFYEGKIQYVILVFNVFNENDLRYFHVNLNNSEVLSYVENNFKIAKEIIVKDDYTLSYHDKIYIYKKIGQT